MDELNMEWMVGKGFLMDDRVHGDTVAVRVVNVRADGLLTVRPLDPDEVPWEEAYVPLDRILYSVDSHGGESS